MPTKVRNGSIRTKNREVSAKKPGTVTRIRKRNVLGGYARKNKQRVRGINKLKTRSGANGGRKSSSIVEKLRKSPLLDKGDAVVKLRRFTDEEGNGAGTRRRSGRILSQIFVNGANVSWFFILKPLLFVCINCCVTLQVYGYVGMWSFVKTNESTPRRERWTL